MQILSVGHGQDVGPSGPRALVALVLSDLDLFPPLPSGGPSGSVGPLACVAPEGRPGGPRPSGYIWIRKGCLDPDLGFPASRLDVRHFPSRIRRLLRSKPRPPLLASFAAVLLTEKSRASSSEALSSSKHGREGSSEAGRSPDLEYEAARRSKLEAERVAREQVAAEHEAWAAGPGACGGGGGGSLGGCGRGVVGGPWGRPALSAAGLGRIGSGGWPWRRLRLWSWRWGARRRPQGPRQWPGVGRRWFQSVWLPFQGQAYLSHVDGLILGGGGRWDPSPSPSPSPSSGLCSLSRRSSGRRGRCVLGLGYSHVLCLPKIWALPIPLQVPLRCG